MNAGFSINPSLIPYPKPYPVFESRNRRDSMPGIKPAQFPTYSAGQTSPKRMEIYPESDFPFQHPQRNGSRHTTPKRTNPTEVLHSVLYLPSGIDYERRHPSPTIRPATPRQPTLVPSEMWNIQPQPQVNLSISPSNAVSRPPVTVIPSSRTSPTIMDDARRRVGSSKPRVNGLAIHVPTRTTEEIPSYRAISPRIAPKKEERRASLPIGTHALKRPPKDTNSSNAPTNNSIENKAPYTARSAYPRPVTPQQTATNLSVEDGFRFRRVDSGIVSRNRQPSLVCSNNRSRTPTFRSHLYTDTISTAIPSYIDVQPKQPNTPQGNSNASQNNNWSGSPKTTTATIPLNRCPICFTTYTSRPCHRLPCSHTLCVECFQHMSRRSHMSCPTCMEPVQNPSQMSNYPPISPRTSPPKSAHSPTKQLQLVIPKPHIPTPSTTASSPAVTIAANTNNSNTTNTTNTINTISTNATAFTSSTPRPKPKPITIPDNVISTQKPTSPTKKGSTKSRNSVKMSPTKRSSASSSSPGSPRSPRSPSSKFKPKLPIPPEVPSPRMARIAVAKQNEEIKKKESPTPSSPSTKPTTITSPKSDECPLCMDPYSRVQKHVLQCGHHLCEDCWKNKQKDDEKCSECRTSSITAQTLHTNSSIHRIQQDMVSSNIFQWTNWPSSSTEAFESDGESSDSD